MDTLENQVTKETTELSIVKGDLVVFNRNGKVKVGKVISKGNKNIGLNVVNMKSNTKISVDTNLVPITIFVEKEVLDNLMIEEEAA